MLEPDGSPNTAHSLNPVPFIVTVEGVEVDADGGVLADVAPTVLELLGIEQPAAMTGRSLLVAPTPAPGSVDDRRAGGACGFLGAGLQSATGFGYAMFAAPILFVLLGPREAVTIGVLLGLVTNGLLLATERRRPVVLKRDAVLLVAWCVPGLVLGAIILREVPERPLSALVAVAVLAGLGLRLRGRRAPPAPVAPRLRAWHAPAAGATSGALATSTSLGGPPLVFYLLARAAEPAAMRDTLAAVFIVEAALGLPVLLLTETSRCPRRRRPAGRRRRGAGARTAGVRVAARRALRARCARRARAQRAAAALAGAAACLVRRARASRARRRGRTSSASACRACARARAPSRTAAVARRSMTASERDCARGVVREALRVHLDVARRT